MTHRAVQIWPRIFIGALIVLMFGASLHGQQKSKVVATNYRVPLGYYDRPHQNQIKALLTGAEGRSLEEGKVLLKQVKLETFAKTGERETITAAPECVFDTVSKVLSSPGPMQMETADGKLFAQGEGFLVRETSEANYTIVISNKVETRIRKDLITRQNSQAKSTDQAATNPAGAPSGQVGSPDATSATNQFVKILSDQCVLNSISNQAVYSGNVLVVDPQMDLSCEVMTLRRSTNGSLESIVAETNVVIIGKQDHSRATGDKAVYIVNPEKETVELSGQAHWQDDQREVKANVFLFDRKDNSVRAEPNAYLKLPRDAIDQSGPMSSKSVTADGFARTNEFIEITSQVLLMQLPTTNRPMRTIIAQTNVVILSAADQSRATGDQAVYTEADGTISLSGKAMWSSNQRRMSGDTLTFDRTNHVFNARGNAYLKLPVSALGKTILLSRKSSDGESPSAAATNLFIEVFSDSADFQNDILNFRENVRGNFLENDVMKGWMICGQLTLELTNIQVKSIVARRNVAVGQVPPPDETARKVYKKLNCDTLTVNISTNGRLESFMAEQNVVAEQNEVRPGTNDIHTTSTAELVTGYFFAQTNLLERMVAERNVFIKQGERSARGARALYTTTNNLLEMTGRPTAQMPEGRITEADAILWDRANEQLSARGSKSVWHPSRDGTNRTNLRLFK